MDPIFVASTLSVLSLITSGVSLYFCVRTGSLPQIQSEVRQLALDVSEVYDKLEHWTRRDRVRKLREGQEKAREKEIDEVTLPASPESAKARKAQLRAKVFGKKPRSEQLQ